MLSRLADRLSQARQRHVVGRTDELMLFQSSVVASELPFYVLHIFGPDGIGKTTLLGEFAFLCAQLRIATYTVDAHAIDPTPDAFLAALRLAMSLDEVDSPLDTLCASAERRVIMIDTYESLSPLDSWVRNQFLPQLPEQVLVVLASRDPPAIGWRADPGWHSLMRVTPLRNLSASESRAYLAARNVPANQHEAILSFTHGYPLALSLVADLFAQRQNIQFRPEAAPDVIKTLLEQLVRKVPGPAHHAALEVCALAHLTTEPLLADMLGMRDVHELFDWLRSLSFIESTRHGLLPHNTVREVLDADVRWRNPEWYSELHRRARVYYTNRLHQLPSRQQESMLFDLVYLHRNNPTISQFFEWQDTGNLTIGGARPDEWPRLRNMVTRNEGEESARIADFWFAREPAGALAVRDTSGHLVGMLMLVTLSEPDDQALQTDPAVRATWEYLLQNAPLRPTERATIFRFWMAHDAYQGVSPTQSLISVFAVRYYLTTPGLAFTFLPCADPEFWRIAFGYAYLNRIEEADFSVGGRRYGMYGHDWRAIPPAVWLNLIAAHELDTEVQPAAPPPTKPTLVVLSQGDFSQAVRDALHNLLIPSALRSNPLVRSRLVVDRAEAAGADRVATLQALIKEACATLQASPRDSKSYRAIYHTYVQPAPTQEQAAELLDLPFSTFRRHLKAGITRITEILWQQELQAADM